MSEIKRPEGWAIVELVGRRRLGGYVTEERLFGLIGCRVALPGEGGEAVQHYSAKSVYSVTWCSEEQARAAAAAFSQSGRPVVPASDTAEIV